VDRGIQRFDGLAERQSNGRLPREIVDLRWNDIGDDLKDTAKIGRTRRMQLDTLENTELAQICEARQLLVTGRAMDLIALGDQVPRKICPVLS
jgi:hypothetical protein